MKHRIFAAIVTGILLVTVLPVINGCSAAPLRPDESRAAIIDQLNPSEPNPEFINHATFYLKNSGFKVDYFAGNQITVDFYRGLPGLGYRLIIIRAHSGLLGSGPKANQATCLFTNQPYSQTGEIRDQLANRVVESRVDQAPPLFGIKADFVRKSMRDKFNGAAIIMMGCSSLDSDDMARAFIDKGASVYTGWNNSVGLAYVEGATLTLLDKLARQNLSIAGAEITTIQEKGADPTTGAILKYYPESSGQQTLSLLIN